MTTRVSCEFSLQHYGFILDEARRMGYRFHPLSAAVRSHVETAASRTILLRHDVDVSVEQAVVMARLEAAKGIPATYFVRLHARYYDVQEAPTRMALSELCTLADVGLHYERGYYNRQGEDQQAMLSRDREALARIIGQPTFGCAAHMPGAYGTFSEQEIEAAGLDFEAYAPAFVQQRKYLSDSAKRWREGPLCRWLGSAEHFTVLIHPVWWTDWPEPTDQVIERLQSGD